MLGQALQEQHDKFPDGPLPLGLAMGAAQEAIDAAALRSGDTATHTRWVTRGSVERDQALKEKIEEDRRPRTDPAEIVDLVQRALALAKKQTEITTSDATRHAYVLGMQQVITLVQMALDDKHDELVGLEYPEVTELLAVERAAIEAKLADHDPAAFTQRLADRIAASHAGDQGDPPTRIFKNGPMR